MTGKILVVMILLCSVVAGGGLYYLQIYGYYIEVVPDPGQDVRLTAQDGTVAPIAYGDFRAIDADSSPIRYRACFTVPDSAAIAAAGYVELPKVEPRNAPGWFSCFDAATLGAALKDGSATAYLGAKNVAYGVDRIVAITQDGRGYSWHELNECGEKAYDGTVIGEECPPRPAPGG